MIVEVLLSIPEVIRVFTGGASEAYFFREYRGAAPEEASGVRLRVEAAKAELFSKHRNCAFGFLDQTVSACSSDR